MENLRIGILGCANIAFRLAIPAIQKITDKYTLVAISSRYKEKAKKFADHFNIEPIVGYEQLLKREDIDIVYLPLPTGLHKTWIRNVISAKKHVIVEKSFSMDYNEALQLIQYAKDNKIFLTENFAFKFHNQHKLVWNLFNSGKIGDLRLFRSQFGFPKLDPGNFRYIAQLGGGSLYDAGAYPIMASQWFLGNELKVDSSSLCFDSDKKIDIYGHASLSNNLGQSAQISFGFDNSYKCNYELWGTNGSLYLAKAFTPKPEEITYVTCETQESDVQYKINPDNQFIHLFEDVYNCIKGSNYEPHYSAILSQAKIITSIFEKAERISL